jgi:hypothetical protein
MLKDNTTIICTVFVNIKRLLTISALTAYCLTFRYFVRIRTISVATVIVRKRCLARYGRRVSLKPMMSDCFVVDDSGWKRVSPVHYGLLHVVDIIELVLWLWSGRKKKAIIFQKPQDILDILFAVKHDGINNATFKYFNASNMLN